jgi:hypothetical protein
VIAGDSYDLNVRVGPKSAASAAISFQIGDIDGNPQTFGPFSRHVLTSTGSAVGQISEEFTILSCPCSFSFAIRGRANANGDASATARDDPFFVQLPPGWTYTLASQQGAAIPEPTSLALTLTTLGVAGIGLIRRQIGLSRAVNRHLRQ